PSASRKARFYVRKRPGVGNFSEQNWGISVSAVNGSWTLLYEVEALIVPPDLAQALAANEEASSSLAALAPSTRKQILYWVASAKRPATRARRVEEAVAAAAENRPVRTDQWPPDRREPS
ncbi:YdeI family protein, partial [Cryobacterium sp. TMT4-10]|uniref:YdeI/OmpD-associated family protein n=1 Tax=Cryobacterium sp. TMT4-10 TaxID=1259256 RepID=UPI001A7E1C0F